MVIFDQHKKSNHEVCKFYVPTCPVSQVWSHVVIIITVREWLKACSVYSRAVRREISWCFPQTPLKFVSDNYTVPIA